MSHDRPTAIVTGASRGIGRGIALELARTHQVIGTYRGRRDAAESLQAEAGIEIFRCDVSSAADRQALIEFARGRFKRLDLLVNNAGMAPRERRDILEATEESFDEVIATNLKGPYFLTQLAARWMREQGGGGRIVFITSISAYTASVNRGEYCISKAGLSMAVARQERIGVYPGTFDPITNGHLDLVARGAKLFDRLVVAILENATKDPALFTVEERMEMLREVLRPFPNVEVDSFRGLLADYVVRKRANVILRGIRAISDYEYELQMALMNTRLAPDVETLFLMSKEAYSFVSSRLVKQIIGLGGNISGLVPPVVEQRLKSRVERGR